MQLFFIADADPKIVEQIKTLSVQVSAQDMKRLKFKLPSTLGCCLASINKYSARISGDVSRSISAVVFGNFTLLSGRFDLNQFCSMFVAMFLEAKPQAVRTKMGMGASGAKGNTSIPLCYLIAMLVYPEQLETAQEILEVWLTKLGFTEVEGLEIDWATLNKEIAEMRQNAAAIISA
ncbi:MAG: hypothetical protein OXR68_06785 [Alphaproteobacteria bacterium]|nr:hypothetical protein [Alphaproteobacteria bacterium]MDD9920310.1 hypothetical protein [Alphaproteobacteria bacterium]